MKNENLIAQGWNDYELIDSGDNRKLERFGDVALIRPETQAIWRPLHPELWKQAQAEFVWNGGKGAWKGKRLPENWDITWQKNVRATMRLTAFKHTGIFPEQQPNWEWIAEQSGALAKNGARPNVLNLFGYTGIASIVAAQHGAIVTHLDASKQSNTWAKSNAILSTVPDGSIRYITDDALKFVEREVRRGSVYDGIILDPPAFGRGADGEVWRIEEHIVPLLAAIKKIFSQKPGSFFLLNGYAAGYAPLSLLQSVESAFPEIGAQLANNKKLVCEFGELRIKEHGGSPAHGVERFVPSGIYVRFTRA